MSWSVGEFTATSVEAAKAECERQVGNVAEREKVLDHLADALRKGDLLITLGAGDVWKLGEQMVERLKKTRR